MMHLIKKTPLIILLFLATLPVPIFSASKQPSNSAIKQLLIKRSIRNYPRNCPCPYSRDKSGGKCGKRSAWHKPGGHSPLCYESDITTDIVKNYRKELEN